MVEVWLPYGNSEVCLTVEPENLIGIITPNVISIPLPEEEILKGLENPLGTGKLRDIVKPKQKTAIAVDSSLKPNLVSIAVSKLCAELNNAEIENRSITVILGCRPDGSLSNNIAQYNFPENAQIKIHNPNQSENLVEIGTTSFKTKVYLNKEFLEADVKILIGGLTPHIYAGYSGGRMVLLSITGIRTIHHNYSLVFHPNSRLGVLQGNQVHLDATEAARFTKINFTINLTLNDTGDALKAFSGGLNEAFEEGVKFLESSYGTEIKEKADILVVSPGGAPHDSTFYSSMESLERVSKMVRDGGGILLVAECSEGPGDKKFYRLMMEFNSPEELKEVLKKQFIYGVHSALQFMDFQRRFKVVIVSTLPETVTREILKLKSAKAVDDALESVCRSVGRKSKILILPFAKKSIPVIT